MVIELIGQISARLEALWSSSAGFVATAVDCLINLDFRY